MVALLGGVLLAGVARAGATDDGPAQAWNVVLISIDTMRADRMSVYGYERKTTPFLEELSAKAVVFERFSHSGGGTLPSHMSMMTSLNPRTHGITHKNRRRLPDARVTLAEHLHNAGYATAAFTDAGWMRAKYGFEQGFDSYDDGGGRFAKILPKGKQWIREHKNERFFLFLHTYDLHSESPPTWPYSCPGDSHLRYLDPELAQFDGCRFEKCATELLAYVNSKITRGEWSASDAFSKIEISRISSTYDGCINYVDEQLREFVAFLVEEGIYDRTLLVITSDHGEEFGEHGKFLHTQRGFEVMSAIPLIIRFPGDKHGGARLDVAAATVDIMPTIVAALGIEVSPEAQGVSLLPAIRAGLEVREDVHMYTVLERGRWKYFPKERLLFDLEKDPGEQVNVFDQNPEVVEGLERRVQELEKADMNALRAISSKPSVKEEKTVLTVEEEEALRALGYLNR